VWVAIRSGGPSGRAFGYRDRGAAGGIGEGWVPCAGVGVGLVDEGGDEGPFVKDG
jgi:hypothetical protein